MSQKQIHFHQTTTLTPEQFIAGLTDFGHGRSELFGNSADEDLKVHHMGRTEADVTEGSGDAGLGTPDSRQGRIGEGVCQERAGHRSANSLTTERSA